MQSGWQLSPESEEIRRIKRNQEREAGEIRRENQERSEERIRELGEKIREIGRETERSRERVRERSGEIKVIRRENQRDRKRDRELQSGRERQDKQNETLHLIQTKETEERER